MVRILKLFSSLLVIELVYGHYIDQDIVFGEVKVDLFWCCDFLKKHSDFIPHETWGSLIGDINRYLREEWDERHCNQLIGSKSGKNCIDIENHRDAKKIEVWTVIEKIEEISEDKDDNPDNKGIPVNGLEGIADIRLSETETKRIEQNHTASDFNESLSNLEETTKIQTTARTATTFDSTPSDTNETLFSVEDVSSTQMPTSTVLQPTDVLKGNYTEEEIDIEYIEKIEETMISWDDMSSPQEEIIQNVNYISTSDGGGCCFVGALGASAPNAIDNYHRSCLCPRHTTLSGCQKLCSEDKNCKGFAQHSNSKSCKLATTSLCSDECHGPYNKDNLSDLDIAPTNCAQRDFNGGCYIKENVCCKNIALEFEGERSSQQRMMGEYTFQGDTINTRYKYIHTSINSTLSFHAAFSRWQVSDNSGSIVLSNYCSERCPEDCADYFWELNLRVLPIWQQYGKAHIVCNRDT